MDIEQKVALLARAWIEMSSNSPKEYRWKVALLARAWIEMQYGMCTLPAYFRSLSLRERGLKFSLLA